MRYFILACCHFTLAIQGGLDQVFAQELFDESQIQKIQACAVKLQEDTKKTGSLKWRTHTRYAAAKSGDICIGWYTFTTCGLRTESNSGDCREVSIRDSVNPPNFDSIVEGKQFSVAGMPSLSACERYIFQPTVSKYNIGTHVHDIYGGVSVDQKIVSCGYHVEGEHKPFGGGGHIYAACHVAIEPVLNADDMFAFVRKCTQEFLGHE